MLLKLLVVSVGYLATITATHATSIIMSGKVLPSPCVVNSDSVSKLIEFQKVEARSMSDAGSTGDWVDFDLNLEDCPVYLTSATAVFSGEPDTDDKNTYKNTGTATNISLQLASRTNFYGNGTTLKTTINSTKHTALFPLSARMYSAKGNVGKGTFASVVFVNFTYQ